MKLQNLIHILSWIACIGLFPNARAVVPAPDGGYPNFTTAEGTKALQSLTTGSANTAVGWFSLFSNAGGSFNTATGAGSLLFNTADANAAFGAAALLFNTTGINNTAVGAAALLHNTIAEENTATGAFALLNNTTGARNTAVGADALSDNTTGNNNTSVGSFALSDNLLGNDNTAVGSFALSNTTAGNNTAIGEAALLSTTTGNHNTAFGHSAGAAQTTGSNNVYIGYSIQGVAGESNACYIGSIFGQISIGGTAVSVNSSNKLGTTTSSKRFKEDIKPMDKVSEALFALNPVAFRYKKEVDATATPQLGLVAEDVEKVNPDLVVRDQEGKPYSVRYDQVNAMLLNEFLKEHRKVQKLETNDAEQQREIKGLVATVKEQAAQIQKVSAQLAAASPSRGELELNRLAPQTVLNNR